MCRTMCGSARCAISGLVYVTAGDAAAGDASSSVAAAPGAGIARKYVYASITPPLDGQQLPLLAVVVQPRPLLDVGAVGGAAGVDVEYLAATDVDQPALSSTWVR
ncbi:hypothetical protein GCM10020220_101820 [Nonomuraea rubra]